MNDAKFKKISRLKSLNIFVLNNDLNKKICPLEEIGNGSVTPCKIPKIIYLINFINTLLS